MLYSHNHEVRASAAEHLPELLLACPEEAPLLLGKAFEFACSQSQDAALPIKRMLHMIHLT
eukprot:m.88798 g.88798  ORF g.88798 m.88798 type:complete len:61 (+) comp8514_c3_seq3:2380-2562(+)